MNISLPAALRTQLEKKLARDSYSSASEYVRELVRRDLQHEAIEKVDTLLLEGLKSGPATPMTKGDWQDLRRIASRPPKRRHATRTPPTSRSKADQRRRPDFRAQSDLDEASRQAYLNAKAGKGLSPAFDTAEDLIAHLHRATKGRKAAARARRKK